jgi:hypothetical protein
MIPDIARTATAGKTFIRERIYLDKIGPNMLHDETATRSRQQRGSPRGQPFTCNQT